MRKLLFVLVITTLSASWVFAQSNDEKDKSGSKTITGCLQKTDHADEFLIKANDGSSWEVRSDSVSLAEHVGHTVTATGEVDNKTAHNIKEGAKDIAHDTGMKKENAEHGSLKVSEVQMVSSSCSQ